MGPILKVTEIWQKENTDNPASTNSNYVINNITTNITCMQVLTIVLLMICNGQNPGSSTSDTSHNEIFKDAATNINALVNALRGTACCKP